VVATAVTKAPETNPAATEAEDKTKVPEEEEEEEAMEVINLDKTRALEEEVMGEEVVMEDKTSLAVARVVVMEEISQAAARAGMVDKISQVVAKAVDMEEAQMIRARGAMEVAPVDKEDKAVRVEVLVELRVRWNQRVFKLLKALLRARDGKELSSSWVDPSPSISGAFCWLSSKML
jgi:hypothetical protein